MDLFTLSASLGLDTSGFTSGLSGVEALVNSAVPGLGTALKGVGSVASSALSAAGSAAWSFAKDVVNTGMDVDKSFSRVQAVLGTAEGTAANMNRLLTNGRSVASDSIFTLSEVGDAYYYMGMAGWKTDQMLAGLPGVINLAAASGEDLATTSDIVTDSLTGFGLGAGQAAHFADVMAAAATNSNTDVSRMGQTFKYLAPVAGALGYSIEDMATSIGVAANAGIKGTTAGTSLRNIITRLATDAGSSSKSIGALGVLTDNLGVSFYDSAGKVRPWSDVITEARDAWKTLDPSKANEVAAAFGSLATQGTDAETTMRDFTSDLDTWQTEWNGLTTDAERNSFVQKYESQFNALGISMRDSKGNLREFNDIASEARIKLGGLTDEEKTFYANKIGNLRGMATWLALMNATDEEYQQVADSINNCTGAAETMAGVKLDNLWGDVVMLNSKLDILKSTLFDEIKGPLRTLVQEAADAIERITTAVNQNGLAGGIQQFANELKNAGTTLEPVFRSLGEILAPLVTTLLDTIINELVANEDTISGSIGKLIGAFTKGFQNYLSQNTSATGGVFGNTGIAPIASWLLQSLTGNYSQPQFSSLYTSSAGHVHSGANGFINPNDPRGNTYYTGVQGQKTSLGVGIVEDAVASATTQGIISGVANANNNGNIPALSLSGDIQTVTANQHLADMIQAEIDKAVSEGKTTVKIGDFEFSTEYTAQEIADAITQGANSGSAEAKNILNNNIASAAETSKNTISGMIFQGISGGGASGAISMASSVTTNMVTGANNLLNTISRAISQGGTSGGSQAADNVVTNFYKKSGDLKTAVSNSLSGAGSSAGKGIASGVQRELNLWKFGISIIGTLTGIFSGSKKYASAMHGGRILHGATIFGVDGEGDALVGGEAGPEAIIGTDELSRLISKAVGASGGDTYNTINIYQQPGQDPRELAEIIQRELVRIGRQQKAVYA